MAGAAAARAQVTAVWQVFQQYVVANELRLVRPRWSEDLAFSTLLLMRATGIAGVQPGPQGVRGHWSPESDASLWGIFDAQSVGKSGRGHWTHCSPLRTCAARNAG